ncbi:MAG: CBS domain-containing protein [Phycisphaerales bacterium]
MGTVNDILDRKGTTIHSVGATVTVLQAAQMMNEHKIGSLTVTLDNKLVGILTERDILTRVVADQRDPEQTKVGEVMTRDVMTCRPTTRLNEARKVMREQRVRHLPVVDDMELKGMVSIGDLNHAEHGILVETIQSMETYIAGGSAVAS